MKTYFNIQLTILILIDLFFLLSAYSGLEETIMLADFGLGLVQLLPTIILAILRHKKYPALFNYIVLSVLVLLIPIAFIKYESLIIVYYFFCFIMAHAFVYLLYSLQKENKNYLVM